MESNNEKIIKSFCVVGLNESSIQKYEEDNQSQYVQNVDIVQKNINGTMEIEGEKWLKITKKGNYWLRIQYSKKYNEPITGLLVSDCEYESPEYLLEKKEYINQGYRPIIFTALKDGEHDPYNNKTCIQRECNDIQDYNNFYMKIPSYCNVKEQLHLSFKSEAATLLITRSTKSLPIKDIQIKEEKNGYKFGLVKCKQSPYSIKYLPEIIDTYPSDGNINRGIAMFCFPEGLTIKKTLDMPKWFSFILTDEAGRRTYGSTLIFTEDISNTLINSLVPIYHTKDSYNVEKAICVLSNYPFLHNCKIFLREIYRIQVSSTTYIPLERAICHFVDSLYFQSIDKMVSFTIAEEELKFYRVPIYGNEWDTVDESIEVLFSLLSYDTILTVWEGLLLEKKVFLLCKSKSVLFHVSMALINLIFPFQWMHILVPVLPEKLRVFIESPVPLLIGLNYPIDLNELPNDSLVLNIDMDSFENYIDKLPKLPPKLYSGLMKSLNKLKTKYRLDNPCDVVNKMHKLDEVFASVDDDIISIKDSNSSNNNENTTTSNNECAFNSNTTAEIRDAFYDFFIQMFKNYEKYFNWKKKKNDEPLMFLKDVFLKDHSSTETGSFLYTFSETSIFTQFEDSFKYMETNSSTSFFLDSIKKGRGKSKVYLPRKIPSISTVIPEINVDDLKGQKFFYKTFPSLDNTLYIKTEIPKAQYQSRFVYMRDEWCYDLSKLNNKDWGKYLMYSIYEIWFTFFAFIIHFYEDEKANAMMEYGMLLIEELILKQRITPSKNLFTKLIKCCGRSCLNGFVKRVLNLVTASNQHYNGLFHNAFMNGLYTLTEKLSSTGNALGNNNSLMNSVKVSGSFRQSNQEFLNPNDLQQTFDQTCFLSYELCPHCLKNKKPQKKISIEEIISGFSRGKSDYASICPSCLNKIFPKLYFLQEEQLTLETQTANFLSPIVLVKEVDNLIKNHGEKYFYLEKYYQDKYHRQVFWNLVFYFQLYDLPLCVMYLQNDNDSFSIITKEMEESIQRRKALTASAQKKIKQMNQSADNRMSTLLSETMSKKYSSASNDVQSVSCRSGKNYFSNLSKYEQDLWKGIQSRMERTANPYAESSDRPSEDRSDVNARIYDIKQIVSKIIEYFVQEQKSRLEKILLNVEYNDNINKETNVFECEEDIKDKVKDKDKDKDKEKTTVSDEKMIVGNEDISKSNIKKGIVLEEKMILENKSPSSMFIMGNTKNSHFPHQVNLKENSFLPSQTTKTSVAIKIKIKK